MWAERMKNMDSNSNDLRDGIDGENTTGSDDSKTSSSSSGLHQRDSDDIAPPPSSGDYSAEAETA